MKKWQLANLIAFLVVVFVSVALIYILKPQNNTSPLAKPWHLMPSVNEDSLSQTYQTSYVIEGRTPLRINYFDSTKINVFIMVDAWGVPVQENVLQEELQPFETLSHKFLLHHRLANNTPHAEHAEFRNNYRGSLFVFGGDSSQYKRNKYIPKIGFQKELYCKDCGNEKIVEKIDSILVLSKENDVSRELNEEFATRFIAWTALASEIGAPREIKKSLQQIAKLAEKHPDVHFVIQGTHRPVLCAPEIKRLYKSHWVPVVILNE